MKQYVTMKKIENSKHYQGLEIGDHRFFCIGELFSPYIRPNQLINWFHDEKTISDGNEWFEINKEHDVIALYDIGDRMSDETIFNLDPLKRFEMSRENFAEIIYQWEQLRVSRPDTILIVIDEDNHISLEADPV